MCASVWRLHEQNKKTSKKRNAELSIIKGRSICPNCSHQLQARDLIPVFSWFVLRGKCRYCNKPIGLTEPLVELVTAALFVFSYIFWPQPFHGVGLFEFILWLIFLTGFIALALYDLRWYVLPNKIVYILLVLAFIQVVVVIALFHGGLAALFTAFWGVVVTAGLFYFIFLISAGKWIGGGDVKLGAVLGLVVGGPLSSVLLLFLASTAGSLLSVPLLVSHRAKTSTRIPFGPFLILAAILTRLFGVGIIAWYKRLYL